MAVPEKAAPNVEDVMDISDYMDSDGRLKWQAPEGVWTVYRIGHAPTMSNPHPLPDELIGKTLEVDKMSREHNIYHWQQLLNPLVEHLQEYIGDSFTFIHIDSYEAGDQDWTPLFRHEFIRLKSYDPLPWIALRLSIGERDDLTAFSKDYKDVVNRLFIDNGWTVAKEMIHQSGLQFLWEPYEGPFDTYESVVLPDVPMGEFWTGGTGAISTTVVRAAGQYGKRIVGAEAFTGRPEISQYTEDPAFLKHSADGSFVSGANWLFLHHWVHQPFDDRYQPGMGMGWWGTHFGRHQTWFKPGKAFMTYLSRCQMLTQQGTYVSSGTDRLHRRTPEAELFFVINPDSTVKKTYAFPVKNRAPELWDAYRGTIRQTYHWREQGDSTYIDLNLGPDESVFVVFPYQKGDYALLPEADVISETCRPVTGGWDVLFQPKLAPPFKRRLSSLIDFGKQSDEALKYFSGTAKYEKTIHMSAGDIGKDKQVVLDLGELHDIAELEVNGVSAGVLWSPPYKTDITPYLKKGDNKITVYVTNNWANRLIGDEQHPADFEWGTDRGEQMGRAMKAYPEWFIQKKQRPSAGRKTFNIWYYHRKDSPLQPAGLLGPVQLIKSDRVDMEKRVQELKDLRWGMFICWSFSTFSGEEWTRNVTDITHFRAKEVDTDQWARTAQEAGMGYILFLTKHHDGFCLWDTQTTDRKVTNAPLGKDVLAKLRKSCDKYGIKLALYFSEGEFDWPKPSADKLSEHQSNTGGGINPEMKKAQLKELLTQYGPVEYIWFDHAVGDGGLNHDETTAWVKQFQPGCFVGYNHGNQASADIRLGEMGKPAALDDASGAGPYQSAGGKEARYLLAEFTYPILTPHEGGAMWFYSLPKHDGLAHPAAKLYEDYLGAVKYGNIFSLDVGPDYNGKLREIDVRTLQEIGRLIRKQNGTK
jgi:alpha-L-fucosidase